MACGGCLRMRYRMVEAVAGPRLAARMVPQVVVEPPRPGETRPTIRVIRRGLTIKAKPDGSQR